MKTRFIFTDIHGHFLTLMALIDKTAKEAGVTRQFVIDNMTICGDLEDRGPRSRQIIQFCIDNSIDVVMGNHELMMVDNALKQASYFTKNRGFDYDMWTVNGGDTTMESYLIGEEGSKTVDISTLYDHIKWMEKLPYYIEYKDLTTDDGRYLVCSHSQIHNVWKMRDSDDKQKKNDFEQQVVWGRPNKVKDCFEIFNVIGHTPQKDGPRVRVPFANIDTGCFYDGEKGYFQLTCLQFPEMNVFTQENIDKEEAKCLVSD